MPMKQITAIEAIRKIAVRTELSQHHAASMGCLISFLAPHPAIDCLVLPILHKPCLTSTHKRGCRGRSPLPEREVSSHVSLPPGGPQARQKKYEWILEVPNRRNF